MASAQLVQEERSHVPPKMIPGHRLLAPPETAGGWRGAQSPEPSGGSGCAVPGHENWVCGRGRPGLVWRGPLCAERGPREVEAGSTARALTQSLPVSSSATMRKRPPLSGSRFSHPNSKEETLRPVSALPVSGEGCLLYGCGFLSLVDRPPLWF